MAFAFSVAWSFGLDALGFRVGVAGGSTLVPQSLVTSGEV